MADIDPKKLLYFASIIENGSLNTAAKVLKVSQPALSTSMDRLEKSLGIRLIDRSPRGIVPTRAGEIIYRHARLIREELEAARRNLENLDDAPNDAIRIGALPSLSGTIVPLALNQWRKGFPDHQLYVVEAAQVDLIAGLLRRELDLVVGLTEVFDISDGLRQQVLFRDTLCVHARPEHPLVGRSDLSWADLVHFRWVSVSPRWSETILGQVMKAMNVGQPQMITVCGSHTLLKSLTASADYLALFPAHASRAERLDGRLVALPLDETVLRRDIAVFFREGYVMDEPRSKLIEAIKGFGIQLSRVRAGD